MLKNGSIVVADSDRQYFFRCRQAGCRFANAIFAQGTHAAFAGLSPDRTGTGILINEALDLLSNAENFYNAHPSTKTGTVTV